MTVVFVVVVVITCLPFKGPDYRLYKSEPELTTVAEVDESNGEEKSEPVSETEAPVVKGQRSQYFIFSFHVSCCFQIFWCAPLPSMNVSP